LKKIKVEFVCTGNICRSPMAEAVFQDMVNKSGLEDRFEITSSGIYHEAGERPHPGTRRVLAANDIPLDAGKIAQQTNMGAIGACDYILALDSSHYRVLKGRGNVHLLLEYASSNTSIRDVPDPYYAGNFEYVFTLIEDACWGLLKEIRKTHAI
jgi:protein-tyrosine phosphatase